MKKIFTVLLVIFVVALVMVVTGGVIMWKNPDKYPIFARETFVEKTLTEEDVVTSFYLEAASDDVDIYPSENGKLSITYYESETFRYTYDFKDGKATFSDDSQFDIKNLFKFHWFNDRPNMKIYLPDTISSTLSLDIATGEISFKNSNFTLISLYINVASGEIELSDITTNNCRINSSSGNISLNNISSQSVTLKVSSGDVSIDNSELNDLDIDISSGDFVSHNLTTEGVTCNVSSGNVRLGVTGNSSDYTIKGETYSGKITLKFGGAETKMENKVFYGNGPKLIKATISSGNLTVIAD